METNKIVGALCATLLAFLGFGFMAEQIYSPHHSDELAFALAVEEDEAEDEVAVEIDLASLLAVADPAAGERAFRKCAACHKVEDGANGVGPHLHRVVGRGIGDVAGFNYSGALPGDEDWTPENLFAFIENPRGWAPGTSMSYAGIKDAAERAALIAWLNEVGGAPIAFDPPAEEAAAEPVEAVAEAVEETAEPVAEAAAEAVEETVEAAEETVAEAAEEAAETTEVAPDAAAEAVEAVEETVAEAAEAVEETIEEAAEAVEETVAAVAPEAAAPAAGGMSAAMAAVFASADLAEGEKVFRKCRACHKVEDGANGVGPHLHGVVGREIAAVDGYRYSDALPAGETWTVENLYAYLENPRGWAPGTKMAFAGLKTSEERANVIAWLNQQSDSPIPLE